MQSTPSLPSLLGLFWPRVVAPDMVQPMFQIHLNYVLMLNGIVWNRTVFTFNLTVLTFNCLQTNLYL